MFFFLCDKLQILRVVTPKDRSEEGAGEEPGRNTQDFTWVDSGLFFDLSGRNTEDKIVFYI